MSAAPRTTVPRSPGELAPMTLPRLAEKKLLGEPIVTATALGGYRAQGRTAERAVAVARDAVALQEAGCFAIVFEAIPAAVAKVVTKMLTIPVIGIGAGAATDGQVLVFHDLLGIYDGHIPRFAKRFADVKAQMVAGVEQYADEVRHGAFPGPE